MKNVINRTLASAVIGIAAGFALNATAATLETTRVTTSMEGIREAAVSYSDLDLTSTNGREALEARIARAAEQVCGSKHARKAGGVRFAAENKRCFDRAVDQAMAQLPVNQVAANGN